MQLASVVITSLGRDDLVPHWMVRGPYTWGRSPTLEQAIKLGNFAPGDDVHVFRCDNNASCDEFVGNVSFDNRTPIWKGKIARNGRDVRLLECSHPNYAVGDERNAEGWPA
jgi:hypothetical protein